MGVAFSKNLLWLIIPRLHDQTNIKQMYSKYTCTTCALIACLLDVCLMFASSCKQSITPIIMHYFKEKVLFLKSVSKLK